MNIFYVLLLATALSLDGFVAGLAYGLKNIRIPPVSLLIVGSITAVSTVAAVFCAAYVGDFMNPHIAVVAGALLLILIGLCSLFQEYLTKDVKSYENSQEPTARKLTISIGRIVISIMAQPETADLDHSSRINALEAVFLGLALGIDNMVATFAAALMNSLPAYTPLLMGCVQMGALLMGLVSCQRLVSPALKSRFPYLPGIILILLGLLRLN